MKKLIAYELRNMLGNFFAVFFGLFFPILMTLILKPAILKNVPEIAHDAAVVRIFITNLLMIPLALMFVGFSALFSQELEKNVISRMSLFGITESMQMRAKMIAQSIVLLFAIILYCAITIPYLGLPMPTFYAGTVYALVIILLSIILFVLSYGIALLSKKFSVCYGITMTLYFSMMILSGMMGMNISDFPSFIQVISKMFPTAFIVNDFQDAWFLTSYNFAPMLQSFLFFGSISGIVCYIALRKNARSSF